MFVSAERDNDPVVRWHSRKLQIQFHKPYLVGTVYDPHGVVSTGYHVHHAFGYPNDSLDPLAIGVFDETQRSGRSFPNIFVRFVNFSTVLHNLMYSNGSRNDFLDNLYICYRTVHSPKNLLYILETNNFIFLIDGKISET